MSPRTLDGVCSAPGRKPCLVPTSPAWIDPLPRPTERRCPGADRGRQAPNQPLLDRIWMPWPCHGPEGAFRTDAWVLGATSLGCRASARSPRRQCFSSKVAGVCVCTPDGGAYTTRWEGRRDVFRRSPLSFPLEVRRKLFQRPAHGRCPVVPRHEDDQGRKPHQTLR